MIYTNVIHIFVPVGKMEERNTQKWVALKREKRRDEQKNKHCVVR